MVKVSLFCHSVIVFGMLFTGYSYASEGRSCRSLFNSHSSYSIQVKIERDLGLVRDTFTSPESAMVLLRDGVLNQVRTANPSKDHIDFFEAQIPVVLKKILVKQMEAISALEKIEDGGMNQKELASFRARKQLERNLEDTYQSLLNEAGERVQSRSVTYEWYMSFFLKSMIYLDVSSRTIEFSQSKESYEVLNRKMNTVMGKTKTFFSGNSRETDIYAALSKDFSVLTKDAYFTKYLPENPLVPVLFIPRSVDIIEAERMGLHFVSMTGGRKDSIEGMKFPLEYAELQIAQNLHQIRSFKDYTNPKSKWLKYHDKIVARIKGDPALEALYAYVLRDAGLQDALAHNFEKGIRIIISIDAHKPSELLREHFNTHKNEVQKIATPTTINAFLKVLYRIEKEALDSGYKN